MDRRQVLTALGAAAIGSSVAKADHGAEGRVNATTPLNQFHAYLCAFHTAKKDVGIVFEAHHYCMPVREGVHQCVIFDCDGKQLGKDGKPRVPRILGVEYIISDEIYRGLPDGEKKYYHPHAYEITSGLLIAPGMAVDAETKLMEGLVNTWGKTWHTWPDPEKDLPLGDPLLMWSATKDGHVSEKLLEERDKYFKVSTPAIRKRRAHIGPVPQLDAPKSLDEIGRKWTKEGPDVPGKK